MGIEDMEITPDDMQQFAETLPTEQEPSVQEKESEPEPEQQSEQPGSQPEKLESSETETPLIPAISDEEFEPELDEKGKPKPLHLTKRWNEKIAELKQVQAKLKETEDLNSKWHERFSGLTPQEVQQIEHLAGLSKKNPEAYQAALGKFLETLESFETGKQPESQTDPRIMQELESVKKWIASQQQESLAKRTGEEFSKRIEDISTQVKSTDGEKTFATEFVKSQIIGNPGKYNINDVSALYKQGANQFRKLVNNELKAWKQAKASEPVAPASPGGQPIVGNEEDIPIPGSAEAAKWIEKQLAAARSASAPLPQE